jgi:hypothetical protein
LLIIKGLNKRDGANISPPAHDALIRKRTSAATSTNLSNLSTFCLYPPTAMHASHCHACLPLPCVPPTTMHASHCYACLLLPCMPSTAMHVSHYHAYLPLPCMPSIAMHVRTFRQLPIFLIDASGCMHTIPPFKFRANYIICKVL